MKATWLCLLCVGCVVSTNTRSTFSGGGGAPSASGPRADGQVVIPNLFGMQREEAIAALRRAGYQGEPSDDYSGCSSVVDGRVIELGQVCYQHPPAGRVQGPRLPITLRVQKEDPWHGSIGRPGEWHLMPNSVGMPLEQARAELRRIGFTREDRVQLRWVDEAGCKPLTVCRTYPDALQRAGVHSDKVIYAGRDPNAKPPEPKPEPAPPTPTPSDASSTTKPPETPKTEPQPEPFF